MIKPGSRRFQAIGTTRYPWEQEAIDFVRAALPDHDPYRVYALFELVLPDGTISEIDLLILTPSGLFLVEVKSWQGAVRGDGNLWTRSYQGNEITEENPRLLANRKAKRLKSRLERTKAFSRRDLPFVEAFVFLSASGIDAHKLDNAGAFGVFVRPRSQPAAAAGTAATPLPGLQPLWPYKPRGGPNLGGATAEALDQAMTEIGILPRQLRRQVGDYLLEELVEDCPGWQDWRARHVSLPDARRRVRIYSTSSALGADRETLRRAAQREFRLLQGLGHPGILQPLEYTENELGPALFFEESSRSRRFDLYLAEREKSLGFSQRLHLVRNLAEILDFAHRRRLTHRSLNPRAIVVRNPEAAAPQLAIGNWHAGSRERALESSGHNVPATLHPDRLVDGSGEAYLAPELRIGLDPNGIGGDIFSFGALVYRIFAGRDPAASHFELVQLLQENDRLSLADQLDGCPVALELLVEGCTWADAKRRCASMSAVLELLEEVEEELTAPEVREIDPEQATKGDLLPGGFQIRKRLGRGSTSVVFLVGDTASERVLKVARTPQHNEVLRDEAEVLKQLRHHGIVELYGVHQVGDRVALELARAGDRTLAEELRQHGSLSLEFLERFGADLLSILQWLEERGISHRDLKPENLGIQSIGSKGALHLVLFDFSLSRAELDRIDLGTPAYLDPFLREKGRRRFDLAADRYAAAMTLHEMATGRLPTYGDGSSDPLFSAAEIRLETEGFFPALRRQLKEFFERAFARAARDRFDNAEEMLRAWRRIFQTADAASEPELTEHGLPAALERAQRATGIEDLGLPTRAFHALERLEIKTAGELIDLPAGRLARLRGVGIQTRQELVQAAQALKKRLDDDRGGAPVTPAEANEEAPAEAADAWRIDTLAEKLFPASRIDGNSSRARGLRRVLGLEPGPDGRPLRRPSQLELAQLLGVTGGAVSQWLKAERERWRRNPDLTVARQDVASLLEARGPMTEDELAAALAAARGSKLELTEARRQALALVRAATEVERQLARTRWTVRRQDSLAVLAALPLSGPGGDGQGEAEDAAQAAAGWAFALGEVADMLAGLDPLPSPESALKTLRERCPAPAGLAPADDARLVRLAAACSQRAAVSSRRELYPRQMSAERALLLAAGVAHGLDEIAPADLRERVRLRYPQAEPLPERPELDYLLERARLDLRWDAAHEVYRPKTPRPQASITSTASLITRTPRPAPAPETVAAQDFEAKLRRGHQKGGALILLASPRAALATAQRLKENFALEERSCDRLLLAAMHEVAANNGVDWKLALAADANPGSRDWANLQRLVELALPAVERQLLETAGTVLLTDPGLLGRYDQIGLLERLRERLKKPEEGRALRGLWTLVPSDDQSAAPKLQGKAIPVLGPAEWAWTPESWVSGAHRVP